jgi:hypothetical protein
MNRLHQELTVLGSQNPNMKILATTVLLLQATSLTAAAPLHARQENQDQICTVTPLVTLTCVDIYAIANRNAGEAVQARQGKPG